MVSVYSSDTRLQEGNRFPHPVSVHKLPRYQADELFPHWGATVAFTLISCNTAYTLYNYDHQDEAPKYWQCPPLSSRKNYFTHKISKYSVTAFWLLESEVLMKPYSSSSSLPFKLETFAASTEVLSSNNSQKRSNSFCNLMHENKVVTFKLNPMGE